jgi:benzylsuccinate CoA-transferase BbsE subunit
VAARGSLVEFERDGFRVRMPGSPLGLLGSPWALRRPAPRLGEHTQEVLGRPGAQDRVEAATAEG